MKNCYGEGDLELYDGRLNLKVDGWKSLPVISLREAAILANLRNDFIASHCNVVIVKKNVTKVHAHAERELLRSVESLLFLCCSRRADHPFLRTMSVITYASEVTIGIPRPPC